MKRLRGLLSRHALWLAALLSVDCFAVLLLWLSDARAFQALAGVILLWSLGLFAFILLYTGWRERKRERLFQRFSQTRTP